MQDLFAIPDESLKRTKVLLKREFAARGWHAWVAYKDSPIIWVDRNDGKAKIGMYSSTPPTSSYWNAILVDDKFATYQFLREHRVAQPETVRYASAADIPAAKAFLRAKARLVVKPQSAAHGDGVSMNITTEEALKAAVIRAETISRGDGVLLQEQYLAPNPAEIRVLCINHKFIGAILRRPAYVTGDGKLSIAELIDAENSQPDRGEPYRTRLSYIDKQRASEYLGEAMNEVPQNGQEVRVMDVANYGAGGETISVNHVLPKWLIEDSEQLSEIVGLPVIGIDYIYSGSLRPEATDGELQPMVLELNRCPSLCIHDEPTEGVPQGAVKAYADYLAGL